MSYHRVKSMRMIEMQNKVTLEDVSVPPDIMYLRRLCSEGRDIGRQDKERQPFCVPCSTLTVRISSIHFQSPK
jgi:hypothetical protein